MRPALLCALLLAASSSTFAEERAGRVDAVYFEVSPGIFVAGGARRPAGARRWVDVSVEGGRVLARVPDDMQVRQGDRIAVRVGERKSAPLAQALPTTTVSRALAPDPNASVGR
jgi:hypothetical protein